jgi:hypothetical protein
MSFRGLPEEDQRALAREHIEDANMNEDQMLEWLRSQDDVAPISIMEGLVEKKAVKP